MLPEYVGFAGRQRSAEHNWLTNGKQRSGNDL